MVPPAAAYDRSAIALIELGAFADGDRPQRVELLVEFAMAREEIAMRVLAAPKPEIATPEIGALFECGALLGAVVRRQESVRLVVQIDADVGEAARREKAGDELPDRVGALAQGSFAALADQLEARASDDFIYRVVECERIEREGACEIVGFGGENEAARARDADHLVDHSAGIGHMDQQGLAGHEIEARLGERQFFRDADLVAEPVGEPESGGAQLRFLDPERIAVDALHARGARQRFRQHPAPMADAAADIEHFADPIERKPLADQFEKVGVPPIIARVAEIFGRVGFQRAKFVGHDSSRSGQLAGYRTSATTAKCSPVGECAYAFARPRCARPGPSLTRSSRPRRET